MLSEVVSLVTSPSLLSTSAVLLFAAALVYAALLLLERRYTARVADRVSDLLLIVPLVLGVLAGLNELSEFRNERSQIQDNLRRSDLDNSISIAMAGLSDIATQQNALCRAGQDTVLIRSMIEGLNDVHARLQVSGLDCAAMPQGRCDALTNMARNTLIWSAAPGHAAEFHQHCDVLRTTEFLEENAFLFETVVRRGQTVNIMPRLRALSEDLQERSDIDRRLSAEVGSSITFRVIALWLIVFAAAVEVARIARNFGSAGSSS